MFRGRGATPNRPGIGRGNRPRQQGDARRMTLPLDDILKIGVNTMLRRTEPATGPWMPTVAELVEVVEQVDRLGFDSLWCGDHIAFAIPFLDPFAQIAQAAVVSRRLTFGTAVYLLPLRHPTPVAK